MGRALTAAGCITLASGMLAAAEHPVQVQVLDLATHKQPAIATVPADQEFELQVLNVLPGASYRISEDKGNRPSTEPMRPADARGFDRVRPPAECAALLAQGLELLSSTDEVQLATRSASLKRALASSPCAKSRGEQDLQRLLRVIQVNTGNVWTLEPGQLLRIVIERLDNAGKPVRAWRAEFRGAAPDVGWRYPTEQAWIVHDICQDLFELAGFVRGRVPPESVQVAVAVQPASPGGATSFQVKVPPGAAATLRLRPHVWAPQVYVDFARSLLGRRPVAARDSAAGASSIAGRLTDLRAAVLEAENQRVGALLTADPASAAGHEEAALILAAFALRESAGPFADTRPLLSRMTAHLAFAGALRGPGSAGPAGRLAELALGTLVWRQTEALSGLAEFGARPAANGAEQAWVRALSMRNDGDWRRLRDPADATLLERLEYFRALSTADSPSRALIGFGRRPLEEVPDWSRLALAAELSVEERERFGSAAFGLELGELREIWGLAHPGRELQPADLETVPSAGSVRRAAAGPSVVRVLDWNTWASSGVRHLCAQLVVLNEHRRRRRGTPDPADGLVERVREVVGRSVAFRFALMRVQTRQADKNYPAQAADFCSTARAPIVRAPQDISFENWNLARESCRGPAELRPPSFRMWFQPPLPDGTAQEAYARMSVATPADALDAKATVLAPFNEQVRCLYLLRLHDEPHGLAAVVREYGPMLDYRPAHLANLVKLLPGEPQAVRDLYERLCAFSADRCPDFGAFLLAQGERDAAAAAFQRALDTGLHRASAAARAEWLIRYYEDKGDGEKAMSVAVAAAQTESHLGLLTMARYQERLRNYDEAVRHYRRDAERYDEAELDDFYIRVASGSGGRFAADAAAALARLFPDGPRKFDLDELLRGVREGRGLRGARVADPGEAAPGG